MLNSNKHKPLRTVLNVLTNTTKNMKNLLYISIILYSTNLISQNSDQIIVNDSITNLDEVIIKSNTILGNKFVARNRTGAAYYLSTDELADFNYTDINLSLIHI